MKDNDIVIIIWLLLLIGIAVFISLQGCTPVRAQEGVRVTVSWWPNSEPDLAGYNVYLGRASRGYDGKVAVPHTDTSFTFHTLYEKYKNDTIYFAVTAWDTVYNESGFSEEVWIWLDPALIEPDTTSPSNPKIKRVILGIE